MKLAIRLLTKAVLAPSSLPFSELSPPPLASTREVQQHSQDSCHPKSFTLELFGKVVRDDGGEGREERG